MINYRPTDWISFVFRIHKNETVRRLLPMLAVVAAYSTVIAFLEVYFIGDATGDLLKNFSLLHSSMGFVISLLLVFRTNTAYERWWEGRRLWGALVNNTRNLAAKLNALLPRGDCQSREFFRTCIPAFAHALQIHLRADSTRTALVPDEASHALLAKVHEDHHAPNQLASMALTKIVELHRQGAISGEELLFINGDISSLMDICGACERIKNTPIPFSYSAFIKKVIFLYGMSLPIGYVFSLRYYAIPISVFIFYILASMELIAEEIEDPFGSDANDLPIEAISDAIKVHVHELLPVSD